MNTSRSLLTITLTLAATAAFAASAHADAQLQLSVSPPSATVAPDTKNEFVVTVSNAGNAPLTKIKAQLVGNSFLDYKQTKAIPSGGFACPDENAGQNRCEAGSIPPGGAASVTFIVHAGLLEGETDLRFQAFSAESDASIEQKVPFKIVKGTGTTSAKPTIKIRSASVRFGAQAGWQGFATVTLNKSAKIALQYVQTVKGYKGKGKACRTTVPAGRKSNCTVTKTIGPAITKYAATAVSAGPSTLDFAYPVSCYPATEKGTKSFGGGVTIKTCGPVKLRARATDLAGAKSPYVYSKPITSFSFGV